MRELQMGHNCPIDTNPIVIAVAGEPHDEFMARLQAGAVMLSDDGKVHDENDLICADQPGSKDQSVTFTEASRQFRIDLDSLPEGVARIAIILTVKPGVGTGTTFTVLGGIRVSVADEQGQGLLFFPLPLASRGETALILAELYRHRGQWKFRAVGQGFTAGLPALAAHFGLRMPEPPPVPEQATGPGRGHERPGGPTAFSGTGFCVHPDGFVLTNQHVIDGAREIIGRTPRHRCRMEVVFADATNDLALLRADSTGFPTAVFRGGRQAQLGENVIVVGYPLGGLLGSGPQVTTGNVSSLIGAGDDTRLLQFTAPTQAGNSGGPLLDGNGAVIGIVSSKLNVLRIHEMTGDIPQNVNFAIKASLAWGLLEAVGVDYQQFADPVASPAPRTVAAIANEARDFVLKIECQE
ncbi:MAG: trypsin-like peptidase domain-containing protein [Gammaproteobacteria bacterium]|nr:trypsin-like peptidase domain-containing protein [Gammaproteobacteria bacterium]MCP5459948.1 trypsin-like peptidase domain-containing protein [Gammaproteobacteria bacterium]